jgi:DUF1365 family protein
MSFVSGLYSGLVSHARFKPRRHALRYRIFMLLLDLDELPALNRRLRLFSAGGFNLLSFDPRRHGDGSTTPLKAQVQARLAAAGLPTGGPVRMLVMPRVLGHGFNPLTVYWCHGPDGALSAILYEVNNTFGERHSYLIPATLERGMVRQACAKDFYVSPFMDMDLAYAFRLRPPGETVMTAVDVRDETDLVLATSFLGRRAELSDLGLAAAWLTHPWMSLGVLAAIHLEALKLWLKGERVRERRKVEGPGVTVVTPEARLAA